MEQQQQIGSIEVDVKPHDILDVLQHFKVVGKVVIEDGTGQAALLYILKNGKGQLVRVLERVSIISLHRVIEDPIVSGPKELIDLVKRYADACK